MAYYQSPRWTAEIADCSMPMTFDTYSNCSFGCMYCFSQYQRGIGGAKEHYLAKEVNHVSVDKIKKMFTDPDNHAGQFAEYIKQRRVMQWGGLSDQFDGYERKFGKTLELLRFFKEIDYPLCFSTKATWWTQDERYMELVRGQHNWNFKFSIITLDEHKAHVIERWNASPPLSVSHRLTLAVLPCASARSSSAFPHLPTSTSSARLATEARRLSLRSSSAWSSAARPSRHICLPSLSCAASTL